MALISIANIACKFHVFAPYMMAKIIHLAY
ncbi:hypothetical protein [uncultured Photobacterium sp.]